MILFGGLVVVADMVVPPASTSIQGDLLSGILIALFSLPALAMLGAGLTSAALGSRSSAATSGVVIGVGVPVAAMTSAIIGAFVVGWMASGADDGVEVAGRILRGGVSAALRISPLIALASVAWVVLVRRLGSRA